MCELDFREYIIRIETSAILSEPNNRNSVGNDIVNRIKPTNSALSSSETLIDNSSRLSNKMDQLKLTTTDRTQSSINTNCKSYILSMLRLCHLFSANDHLKSTTDHSQLPLINLSQSVINTLINKHTITFSHRCANVRQSASNRRRTIPTRSTQSTTHRLIHAVDKAHFVR